MIKKVTIKKYKSIENLIDFELKPLNVIIGANCSGKTNFIDFFKYFKNNHYDRKNKVIGNIQFDNFKFEFETKYNSIRKEQDLKEENIYKLKNNNWNKLTNNEYKNDKSNDKVIDEFRNWKFYEYKEYPRFEGQKKIHDMLKEIKKEKSKHFNLKMLSNYIRSTCPFIKYIDIKKDDEVIYYNHYLKKEVNIYDLSLPIINYIYLVATIFFTKKNTALFIDCPEFGINHYCLEDFSELIHCIAYPRGIQVIIITQSPSLLSSLFKFEKGTNQLSKSTFDDIIINNRKNGISTFERVNVEKYKDWFDQYSVGDLWYKNIISAQPVYENNIFK